MPDLTEVISQLDDAHRRAKAAFRGKDFGAYMSLFGPDLRYRQLDGKVIDRDRLGRDIRAQFSRIDEVKGTFDREQIEWADGKAIEILSQKASARTTVFLVLHRILDVSRRGRYVWNQVDGRWLIEEVEILAESVHSRGFAFGVRPPVL